MADSDKKMAPTLAPRRQRDASEHQHRTHEVEALDDPAAETPPLRPEVLDSLLQKVEWRRRRTRRISVITLAAAAAVLAIALVVGIWPAFSGQGDETLSASAVTMSKAAQTPINATVTLTGFGWGTRIDMVCTYGDYASRGEATTRVRCRRQTSTPAPSSLNSIMMPRFPSSSM